MDASMKQIEIDGKAVGFDPEKSFGAISQEIKMTLAPDRVVTEIFVNDKAVDLVEEEELNARVFKEIGDIKVRSREVHELFRESLQMAPRICEALTLDCSDVHNFISDNNLQSAKERVSEMTSLLEWLLQLISGVESLGNTKLEELTFSRGRVMDSVNRMQFLLAKLHLSLSGEKWEDFRTTMSGEFKTEVENWGALFTELANTWKPRSPTKPN